MQCVVLALAPFGLSSANTGSGSGRFLLLLWIVVARACEGDELSTTQESLLPGCKPLRLAAPGAQCLLLQRARIRERQLPWERSHLTHQVQRLRRLRRRLAARQERNTWHGARHIALERTNSRLGGVQGARLVRAVPSDHDHARFLYNAL